MDRRAALALVRTPPLRAGLRLPSLPRPGRRALAITAAALGSLIVLYAVARESSLFAVRTVELTGAPREVEADAREALAGVHGRSLVALDPREIERRLERVPTVRAAAADRAFPHGLEIRITPEEAAAVYRDGTRAWLLASSGRVLAEVKPSARPGLPRIRLPVALRPQAGGTIDVAPAGVALGVLAELPRRFPARVLYAQVDDGGAVAVVVEGGLELRLGDASRAEEKLASAAAVLRTLPTDERTALAYLDLTTPERVVASVNSEVESES